VTRLRVSTNLASVKIIRYDNAMSSKDTYHHGDLKATILGEAAVLVAARGAAALSLRELARAAGVSHAAPAHHFTDRRGLFTALATEGFRMLADALAGARPNFLDAALAYVRFAIEHPGHYAVMFDKSLYDAGDQGLVVAETAAGAELAAGVRTLDDPRANDDPQAAQLAAWSLVHGFSLLWLNKAIDNDTDPIATVHRVAGMLYGTEVTRQT
jgi:AcrR family transcriptional regulator